VSGGDKLELLGLIDRAVAEGWAHARCCRVLDLADVRAHRWRRRLADTGTLEDRHPGGEAVHGLLTWEEQAILDLSRGGRACGGSGPPTPTSDASRSAAAQRCPSSAGYKVWLVIFMLAGRGPGEFVRTERELGGDADPKRCWQA